QYAAQQSVLERMAAFAPGRVRLETMGVTEEGRPMRTLIISAERNMERIDDIRSAVSRLAVPGDMPESAAAALVTTTPVIVMLSYSIHGYEAAGFEAAMWVAYQLIASDEALTRQILDSVVVVLNPSANPDGHERLAVWYNSLPANTADEPWAFYAGQGDQPWEISGRYNHYRFDMNRDLIAQSQNPTRAMMSAMMRWHPQVFVDHHSTTDQFFFPPPALPVNANLPEQTVRWMEIFGRGNAAAFDRYGWTYYTRDIFDLYYPGYFDSWPSLNGATGMTYETDGGPQLSIRKDDGTVVTFREGIAHHYVASLATLETAMRNRTQRLLDYYEFKRSAVTAAATTDMKRVVIDPRQDETTAALLTSLLLRAEIEVTRLSEPYVARAAHDYMNPDSSARRMTFGPGALVVDLAQPQGRLARTLLEPNADLGSEFVRRQLERYERNQRRGDDAEAESYEFYDVTAWSLPYTMGLQAYWTEDLRPVTGESLALPPAPHDPVRSLAPSGGVDGRAQSAYVFANDRLAAGALALRLVHEGFTLGIAQEPLHADGREYPQGTFVARVARNPERLHDRIGQLAVETGIAVNAIESAFPAVGGAGVGSESVRLVREPRILVAAGSGIRLTSFGALWHFMDRELAYDFVPVKLGDIGGMRTMADYNVFILPGGFSGAVHRELGSHGIDRLKNWVRDGGVLIAYDGAGLFLSDDEVDMSSVETVSEEEDEDDDSDDGDGHHGPDLLPPLMSPSSGSNRPTSVPGSIFRATLDLEHWLTLGYEANTLPVMINGTGMLTPTEDGDNPVVFVGEGLALSGFVWPEETERFLRNSAWATVERFGAGKIVQFADDPLFRAFWRGPARLLTNAMLIGPGR
ncbi:MAG: M14 family zinc carboxypeptidase, partial [Gemmatimonadales bacterium]